MALNYEDTRTLPAPGLLFWPLCFSGWRYCIIKHKLDRDPRRYVIHSFTRYFLSEHALGYQSLTGLTQRQKQTESSGHLNCDVLVLTTEPLYQTSIVFATLGKSYFQEYPPFCLSQTTVQPTAGAWQVTKVVISYLRSHLYLISIRANPL